MATTLLYCGHVTCGVAFGTTGEVPTTCPACRRATTWKTAPPELALTREDRQFLKSIKVATSADGHLGAVER